MRRPTSTSSPGGRRRRSSILPSTGLPRSNRRWPRTARSSSSSGSTCHGATRNVVCETLSDDPLTRWRVTKAQWKQHRQYDRWTAAAERAIQRTNVGHAPWFIIDGADERYRNLAVATGIRDALYRSVGTGVAAAARQGAPPAVHAAAGHTSRPARQPRVARRSRALGARCDGHEQDAVKERVQDQAAETTGAPVSTATQGAESRPLRDPAVRGVGRRGQGRRHPADRRGAPA